MTPIEFKAWFDGYTEEMKGAPTKAQWEKIKARVSEIDGKPVTERVYLDRYWHWNYPYYYSPTWTSNSLGASSSYTMQCSNTSNGGAVGAN